MHEYPFSFLVRDRFVEMVEDIIGTDDAIAITDEGRTLAVILDAAEYERMTESVARGDAS